MDTKIAAIGYKSLWWLRKICSRLPNLACYLLVGSFMSLSIRYRSLEPMHPKLAFQIKKRAAQLNTIYPWAGCESVQLQQGTDGILGGDSTTCFLADPDLDVGINDAAASDIAALVDVLCELSREFEVDWQLEHDYETDVVGYIRFGIADAEVLEELETICAIGEMIGEYDEEEGIEEAFGDDDGSAWATELQVQLIDDPDEPRLLKFPGVE